MSTLAEVKTEVKNDTVSNVMKDWEKHDLKESITKLEINCLESTTAVNKMRRMVLVSRIKSALIQLGVYGKDEI